MPTFYQLIQRLKKKMNEADLSIRMTAEDVSTRRVAKNHKKRQELVRSQSLKFSNKEISARKLLKTLAHSKIVPELHENGQE